MTNFGLKLPALFFHEAFNVGAFNIKVFTNVGNTRGVLFLALFGHNAGTFDFSGRYPKRIRKRQPVGKTTE